MPWIPDFTYWIPDRSSLLLGSWIPIVGDITDSLSCIPDSKAQASGFHLTSKNFPDSEIRIPLHGVNENLNVCWSCFRRLQAVSLFFRFSEGSARACERQETRETRAATRKENEPLSSGAFSHARGHLRVSRVLIDGTKKRETARSLLFSRRRYYMKT